MGQEAVYPFHYHPGPLANKPTQEYGIFQENVLVFDFAIYFFFFPPAIYLLINAQTLGS